MDSYSFAWTGYRAQSAHSRSSSSTMSTLPYRCALPESNVRDAVEDDLERVTSHAPPSDLWPRFESRPPSSPSLDGEIDTESAYDCSPSPPQFSFSLQPSRYDLHSAYNSNSTTTSNNNITTNNHIAYASTFDVSSSYGLRSATTQSFNPQSSPTAHTVDTLITDTPEPPVLYLTDEYKALAEPMSAWIADYIVKTLDRSQSPRFLPSLTAFIRGVLWSTMLQPSAILLALYYLSKFPTEFLPNEQAKTAMGIKFRQALFGDGSSDEEACRKLFVCIAMLADRELHDNCFSSATWSEITHISMSDLSALDFCSLHMLDHSLWVPPESYYDWVIIMRNYHASLGPDSLSAHVGRKYHDIMSMQIDHVLSTLLTRDNAGKEPTFIKPGEQLLPSALQEDEEDDFELDIDLDEGGPLPEEYVPRRVASFSSRYSSESRTTVSTPITPCSAACTTCEQESFKQDRQRQWLSDTSARNSFHSLSSDIHSGHTWKSIESLQPVRYSSRHSLLSAGPSSSPTSRGGPTLHADYVSYSSRPQWLLS